MSIKDGLFWAFGIGGGLGDRAVILMYHSIADLPDHFNSVAPSMFARQMEHLAEKRFPVIRLSELAQRLRERQNLGGAVVLTFDDGFRNNSTAAFPILKKYGFSATIFVATGRVGTTNEKYALEYMRENELKELEASGLIDIEPHTDSHPKLTQLIIERARGEIARSREFLRKLLGKQGRFFAYPYGDYNDDIKRLVKEFGFDAAVTVREGTVGPESDDLELPRNSIDSSTTFMQFRGKVSRAIDRHHAMKRLFHI